MKKIIATVLAMVMALALCSTAFAATTSTVEGYAKPTDGSPIGSDKTTYTYWAAKTATVKDNKTTNLGNLAYYTADDTHKYVVVGSKADADVVVYREKDTDSSVLLYLAEVNPTYYVAKVTTNFGTACGQYTKPSDYSTSDTYYVAEFEGDDYLFVGDTDGKLSVLVDGKLISVSAVNTGSDNNPAAASTVSHVAVPTYKDGKVTGYTCTVCKLAAVEAANFDSIPSDGTALNIGNWYWPATTSSNTNTDTKKSDSAKTFDAGIALYAGMALTSVAGSAVVLGKKKEF